jgi:putative FmdB family regulatory protein
MPLFEYECTDCGRQFEAFVTSSRKAVCPSCKGEKLEKLVSRLGRIGSDSGRSVPAFTGGG